MPGKADAAVLTTPALIEATVAAHADRGGWRRWAWDCCCSARCSIAEVAAAVQTWDASTAYNHCFLIIPIALYLLWDRRQDLVGIPARPILRALLLALPLAVAWLASERLGIMEGRQLAAISFVEVLFLALLGRRLWWAHGRAAAVSVFPGAVR